MLCVGCRRIVSNLSLDLSLVSGVVMTRMQELLLPFAIIFGGVGMMLAAWQMNMQMQNLAVGGAIAALVVFIGARLHAILRILVYVLPVVAGVLLLDWIMAHDANDVLSKVTLPAVTAIVTAGVVGIIWVILFRAPLVASDFDLEWLNEPAEGTEATAEVKQQAFEAADGKCAQCKCNTIFGAPNTKMEMLKMLLRGFRVGHAHHEVPYSKGGKGVIENIVWMCAICNLRLGDQITFRSIEVLRKFGDVVLTKPLWRPQVELIHEYE